MVDAGRNVVVAAETDFIGTENGVILAAGRQNTIAVKRLRRIEIEHKHQFATHEGQYLIIVFSQSLRTGRDWKL